MLLYNKCEWFRNAVNAVWAAVKEFFVDVWSGICSFFTETIPNAWNTLVSFFQKIPGWWSGLWQGISSALPLPDSYDVGLSDVEADFSGGTAGLKSKLEKDTSYKGLWTVSFTLNEF